TGQSVRDSFDSFHKLTSFFLSVNNLRTKIVLLAGYARDKAEGFSDITYLCSKAEKAVHSDWL
ncbi:hypothetical protein, partial [Phocaeicola sp.]|uniref:hypothetical protein n=1 Tax=Phocaeicola sp. TaxID=2773926 RepID=UPI0023C2AD90